MDNHLKQIDFLNGIHAKDIIYNDTLLANMLNRERLRVGGYGIVEGFEIQAFDNFRIKISNGTLINNNGEEIFVDEQTLYLGPPDSVEITETLTVDRNGEIKLKFIPYSPQKCGYITNDYYQSKYPIDNELLITDAANPLIKIKALHIYKNIITLDAALWSGLSVTVKYRYSLSRADTIMVSQTGTYKVEKGTMSTSPSHIDPEDYPDYWLIGIAEVVAADNSYIIVHNDYKSYRKVYVDRENKLWLNGKLYKEAQIVHFEEPDPKYENALWYDKESNALMIWRAQNGEWIWVPINDFSTLTVREKKIWTVDDFPQDAQTFLFGDDETNLHFVPNTNALEIIIDNAVLMSDQYEEIVDPGTKDYMSVGKGFRLKNPLDRPTYVECRVLHKVQASPLRRTFQRASIFCDTNYMFYNQLNTQKVFSTNEDYVIGENQLEVFVDGVRLEKGYEFVEMVDASTEATPNDKGKLSKTFKIKNTLTSGQKISYKISRYLWSYDNVDALVSEIEKTANDAMAKAITVDEKVDNLSNNTTTAITNINSSINTINASISTINSAINPTNSSSNLINYIKTEIGKIKGVPFYYVRPANSIVDVPILDTDYCVVHYITSGKSVILIKGIDYEQYVSNGSLNIVLNSSLVNSSATLYITGIKFGA